MTEFYCSWCGQTSKSEDLPKDYFGSICHCGRSENLEEVNYK